MSGERVVWKETFPVGDVCTIDGRAISAASAGRGLVSVWFEHQTDESDQGERVAVFGTGHLVPEGWEWVATWADGPFIWHLYRELGR